MNRPTEIVYTDLASQKRVPRECGDEPSTLRLKHPQSRVPRECGDEPSLFRADGLFGYKECSPRVRG